MKYISCNEQHDTFLLTQLKTKWLGFFSEKVCVFATPQKKRENIQELPVTLSEPANIMSMLT